MKRRGAVIVAAVVVSSLGAIAGADPTPSEVAVRLFQFRPGQLEVKVGTRVTWTNRDDIAHTVTSGTPEARDGGFDRPLAGIGAATTVEFARPGTYPYFCEKHPSMRGVVRVD